MNIDEQQSIKINTLNDKEEEKDEETLVLIQFTDLDDAQYCQHFCSSKFKTINIDKSNPIIQIGDRVYTGEYTNNIGTYLFFEENLQSTNSNKSTLDKEDDAVAASSSSTNLNDNHSNEERKTNNNNLNSKSDKEEEEKSSNLSSSSSSSAAASSSSSSYFGKSFKKLILTRLFIEERPKGDEEEEETATNIHSLDD
jgi:hypothetical protein